MQLFKNILLIFWSLFCKECQDCAAAPAGVQMGYCSLIAGLIAFPFTN